MADIISIALDEVGTKESGDNKTKYGRWYGMNGAAWCDMFVSWCASGAGVLGTSIPKMASCQSTREWFTQKGKFQKAGAHGGSYTPVRGDVIIFGKSTSHACHIGLVNYAENGKVYTVEGNYDDKVAKVTHSLSDSYILGYGVTGLSSSATSPSTPSSSETSSSTASSVMTSSELLYVNKLVDAKLPSIEDNNTYDVVLDKTSLLNTMTVQVVIVNEFGQYVLPVQDGLQVTWERTGTPGKLTFTAFIDATVMIEQGNPVRVYVNEYPFFFGFVFSRQNSKMSGGKTECSITVYDQLRYFKNKDTYIYVNKKASELINMIASDYGLNCGSIADTGYALSRTEDNSTLFDMIQNALDDTMLTKSEIYTLYDDFGKLTLKNMSDMFVLDSLMDDETAEDFTYKDSIDGETYNKIKLLYEDKDSGLIMAFIEKDQDTINKWGILQYFEKVDSEDVGKQKAKAYLKYYNRESRSLSISDAIGNVNVRAGSLIPVKFYNGDTVVNQFMLVETVTHKFSCQVYTMDLTLSGGDYSA